MLRNQARKKGAIDATCHIVSRGNREKRSGVIIETDGIVKASGFCRVSWPPLQWALERESIHIRQHHPCPRLFFARAEPPNQAPGRRSPRWGGRGPSRGNQGPLSPAASAAMRKDNLATWRCLCASF